jgi:hypothetical protein
MNNELKRIWKQASLPYSIYFPGIGVASLKIKTKKIVTLFHFLASVRNRKFPNKNLEIRRYANLSVCRFYSNGFKEFQQ